MRFSIVILVQANNGQSVFNPGITVSGPIAAVNGASFLIRVSYYENDGGGVRESVGNAYRFNYDAASACWVYEYDTDCTGDVGPLFSGNLELVNNLISCDVDLFWNVSVSAPE